MAGRFRQWEKVEECLQLRHPCFRCPAGGSLPFGMRGGGIGSGFRLPASSVHLGVAEQDLPRRRVTEAYLSARSAELEPPRFALQCQRGAGRPRAPLLLRLHAHEVGRQNQHQVGLLPAPAAQRGLDRAGTAGLRPVPEEPTERAESDGTFASASHGGPGHATRPDTGCPLCTGRCRTSSTSPRVECSYRAQSAHEKLFRPARLTKRRSVRMQFTRKRNRSWLSSTMVRPSGASLSCRTGPTPIRAGCPYPRSPAHETLCLPGVQTEEAPHGRAYP